MGNPRQQLIVLQQSPFCNINCQYCYLPDRLNKARMRLETLTKIYHGIFSSSLIHDPITFLWHAGEPLAVGHTFMEQAFTLSEEINRQYNRSYTHNIQTNGTLIDQVWIELFQKYSVHIGLSLDGPEFIHNQQRVDRKGMGTFARVMKAVDLLQSANIPFDVIMVLTYFALDYPDEVFDFFVDHNIKGIALNIDEIEGVNYSSSYDKADAVNRYKLFMRRFFERIWEKPGLLRLRELYSMMPFIMDKDLVNSRDDSFNNMTSPLRIITFDHMGRYNTFCPEFSGTRSLEYGDFVMGDIHNDPIEKIFDNPVFQKVDNDIQAGTQLCRSNCEYWSLCGGGAPSNKFFETGHLDVTETKHCHTHVKVLADTIVEFLEERLNDA